MSEENNKHSKNIKKIIIKQKNQTKSLNCMFLSCHVRVSK